MASVLIRWKHVYNPVTESWDTVGEWPDCFMSSEFGARFVEGSAQLLNDHEILHFRLREDIGESMAIQAPARTYGLASYPSHVMGFTTALNAESNFQLDIDAPGNSYVFLPTWGIQPRVSGQTRPFTFAAPMTPPSMPMRMQATTPPPTDLPRSRARIARSQSDNTIFMGEGQGLAER